MPTHRRVLFVAEAVTLAQVVRLASLGQRLPRGAYELHFAASHFDPLVFPDRTFIQHELYTLPAKEIFKAMQQGKRLYEKSTLKRYVEADLALIDWVRPDLIVGDFRLSLNISAELRQVPWGVLINAYWSPYAVRDGFPVPDHPILKLLGEALTARYFPQALPSVFRHFAEPVNALRRHFGLRELGSLLEVLTHADYTLYPDAPSLVPLAHTPSSHRFLGPVLWEPAVPMPELTADERPLVYLTLGSSGDVGCLPQVLEALASMPVRVVMATAGRVPKRPWPANFVTCDFVPGGLLAERAALVVSNGGSSTSYQALAAGTPVLGLPSNLDQYLTMQALTKTGAALELKARNVTSAEVRRAVERVLADDSFAANAKHVASDLSELDAGVAFHEWATEVLGDRARRAPTSGAQLTLH